MSRIDDQSSHLAEDEAFEEACERELVAGQAIHCCPGCQPGQGGDIEITPAVTSEIKVNLKPEKVDFKCPSCGDAMTGFVNFRQWYISPMAEDGGDGASSYFNHEGCSGAGGNYILVCSFDGENLKFRGEPIPLELEEPEPAANGPAVEPFDYKDNPSALFHEGCGYEVHVRKSGNFVLAKADRFPEETLPKEPTDVEVTCWECDEKFTVRLEDFFTEEELSFPSPSEVATPNRRALSITHSSCHVTRFWDLSLRRARRGQEDIVFKTLLPRTKRTAATTVPIAPIFTDDSAAPVDVDPAAPGATASTPVTPATPIVAPPLKKPGVCRPSSIVATSQEKTMVMRQGGLSATRKFILSMVLGVLGAGTAAYIFLATKGRHKSVTTISAPPVPSGDKSKIKQPVVTPLPPLPVTPLESSQPEPPCPETVWCSFPKNPDAAGEPFLAKCFGATAEVRIETYDPVNEKAKIRVKIRKGCAAVVEISEAGLINPVPIKFKR